MIFLFIEIFILFPLFWVGWRYIKQHTVFKDTLANIPGPPTSSFLKGNIYKLFNINGWQFHNDIATRYGSVVKFKAMLGSNCLYVSDPKAMYHIFVKDQYLYERMVDSSMMIFGEGLLGTLGDQHKKQRKMLNPVFSTVHMREMIPTFWAVSRKLRDTFLSKVKNGTQEIDVNHWMSRLALELIGQSGLGYSFDQLTGNGEQHPYYVAAKQLVPVSSKNRLARDTLLPIIMKLAPPKFLRRIVDIVPSSTVQQMKDIIDVMYNTSVEILESKRKALSEGDESVARQIARGKDIMSILLNANMNASEEDRLSEKELLGQISTFVFAGMDTTSNALTYTLYLLAKHPEVQDKLRKEILQAFSGDVEPTYDDLESLRYLDAVCRETLRLHPPFTKITRIARQDMILPLSESVKGRDGSDMNEIFVPKNTCIVVSILDTNRNKKIWGDDALEWKPERWLSPLPESVKDAHVPGVYSNLMTFIGGGRSCIGFKFAQLEIKVVLVMLFKSFRFAPSEKDIFWAMNLITTPSVVGGDPQVSSLPLIMSPI
ncbi:cytochrome P450 [Cyathus striatus]|nr:cytochrome P450 [Cyathus striatus]